MSLIAYGIAILLYRDYERTGNSHSWVLAWLLIGWGVLYAAEILLTMLGR